MDQMKIFKDNMKFLERLRNTKGSIDKSSFKDFEKQHKAYKKNLLESTNLITQMSTGASSHQRSTSVSKAPF